MSEEIKEETQLVNKATTEGAFVVGGVGGVIAPESGVGNAPVANFGQFGTPTSVNPHATASHSMLLPPQQANQFINYIWDATVLAKEGRKINMRGNTAEISKVNVGERLIRGANQADGDYINAGAKFSKVELTTKKIRLDWEFSSELLEDNLMGAAFEDYIVRLMTGQIGNDIEDLAVNGDASLDDPFLKIMDGFLVQAKEGAHEVKVVKGADDKEFNWTPDVLQQMVDGLPRRYRALKNGYKFYVGSTVFGNIIRSNGILTNPVYTAQNTQNWLDGQGQILGQAGLTTTVRGIPVVEVPYYPEDYVELTFPDNRIWGIQRDIKINREYIAKKDTTEWTVYLRFGIAWEELDAMAWAEAPEAETTP